MAGEIEDYISLQAEHLPTGSISFGRFEVESLSWERRSSFSHNRYLEEVEKCSTPGSVTQKRAILEAHFKKKGLLPQFTLENQNEAECQTATNDTAIHKSCLEESAKNDNAGQPEFAWYDDTPAASDEHEGMGSEEGEEISSEFPVESTPCSDDRVVGPAADLSEHEEIIKPQLEHDSVPSSKDKLPVVVEEEPDNKAVIMEELIEKDVISKSPAVEKKEIPRMKKTQKTFPRMKEAAEQKTSKTKLRDPVAIQQNLRKPSTERNCLPSGKMLTKSTGKVEKKNAQTMRSVKQSPLRIPRPTSSESKILKLQASETLKAKVRQDSRSVHELDSEEEVKSNKSSIMPHSISGKFETDVPQPADRPSRTPDSTKEEVKLGGVVFNFRSDERAEKRKEYFTKLEEKLHAKAVEMNEIQARTQEEREAQMKQFRRSLNFKATPMPSFYHAAVPRVSERKKKVETPVKSQKLPSKCTTPGSRTASQSKSLASSKVSNRQGMFTDESTHASESVKKASQVAKKEENKPKLEQPQQGESSGKKRESVNGLRRGRLERKAMKGSLLGENVVVHVAS